MTNIIGKNEAGQYSDRNKRLVTLVCRGLLVVHFVLLILFLLSKVYFMAWINLGSIVVYHACIFIARRYEIAAVHIAYIEIAVHMLLATISVGWGYGFQLYFFTLVPISFLCDYLAKQSGKKFVKPIYISMAMASIYVAEKIYTLNAEPFYSNSSNTIRTIVYVINSILMFGVIILFMTNYEKFVIKREENLKDTATTDVLTGISNRLQIQKLFCDDFEDSCDVCGEIAVSIFDIDDFKRVNDTYGHAAGDYVLRELAKEISKMEDDRCFAGRWGGEEFLVFTSGHDSYSYLIMKIKKLVRTVAAKQFMYGNTIIPVTITAGVAKYHGENDYKELIERADSYLYEGKNNGKNQVVAKDR